MVVDQFPAPPIERGEIEVICRSVAGVHLLRQGYDTRIKVLPPPVRTQPQHVLDVVGPQGRRGVCAHEHVPLRLAAVFQVREDERLVRLDPVAVDPVQSVELGTCQAALSLLVPVLHVCTAQQCFRVEVAPGRVRDDTITQPIRAVALPESNPRRWPDMPISSLVLRRLIAYHIGPVNAPREAGVIFFPIGHTNPCRLYTSR